jgi:hypothetical protein
MADLIAFVVAGLIYHRHMALVVLVALLAVGANLPTETITAVGYDPDYLLAGLIALVLLPFVRNL